MENKLQFDAGQMTLCDYIMHQSVIKTLPAFLSRVNYSTMTTFQSTSELKMILSHTKAQTIRGRVQLD